MPTSTSGGKNQRDEILELAGEMYLEDMKKEKEYTARLPEIRSKGEAALRRLLPIAKGNTGQCRHVAAFLLGLYNGRRFPFDLTDLRCVDLKIFEDCMTVLQMDFQPAKEVHTYFQNGGQVFEQLAQDWRVPDRLKLHEVIRWTDFPVNGCDDDLRAVRTEYLESQRV